MNIRRSMMRLGIGAAALTGVLAGTVTSANAQVNPYIGHGAGSCPSNWVCAWAGPNFVREEPYAKFGAMGSDQSVPDMNNLADGNFAPPLRWGMNDLASSVVNNTWSSICFYEHSWYSGIEFKTGPREQWPYVPWWIDNKIGSFKWC
ncbi:peptidase inhibitor family I36 protein [Streptomyces sp. NPDC059909]|uniref:peptidase inhibitor family I36 protein n=1 Tax=Streptomyces sp. NPDC059909 TaxID=3346998 RepID=UPI0036497480